MGRQRSARTGRFIGVLVWSLASIGSAHAAELSIDKVWPQKLLCAPREQQTVTVTISNRATTTATARLVVDLCTGFDAVTVVLDEPVSVLPNASHIVPVSFAADPATRGWDARARLLQGDTLLAEASDTFVVTAEPWSVAHYTGFLWSYGLNVEYTVERFRDAYCCIAEQFGQGQAYVGKFVPDREEWISNGGYREKKSTIKQLVRKAQESGVKITAYFWSSDFGPDGFEFARQHPEWVRRTKAGEWMADYNVDVLDRLEDDAFRYRMRHEYDAPGSDKTPMWFPINYDWHNLDLVKHHAAELIRAKRELGYHGFRYDAWLQSQPCPDIHGKDPTDALSMDEMGARNHTLTQQTVRKAFPDCLFGYNYGVRFEAGREGTNMDRNQQMWQTVCQGNYMLLEETVALWQPNHVFHDWEYYRKVVKDQSYHVLDNGGYYYIHLCRAGVIKSPLAYEYQAALAFASRAHVGAVGEVPHSARGGVGVRRVNAFALRFADQIFDPQLRDLPDKDRQVSVSDDTLWWKEYVYTHRRGGHDEWVIHLLNPPPSSTPDPEMKETRPPCKDVTIALTPPDGKTIAKAWAVSPDAKPFITPLTVTGNRVAVPDVKVWSVVCVEWR